MQDLVVPVRPLDQPDRHRRPAALDPGVERPEVVLGLGQVRLGDDADVGPVAELGLGQDRAEDGVGQVLVGVLLHVDVDVRPDARGPPGGSAGAGRATRVGGRLGVEGVEPGGQARELEREVRARDRAAVVAVDLRDLGLGGQRAGQAAEQVEAGLLVGVGLGLADDRLAEQVGGEGQPLADGAGGRSAAPRPGVVAGDEPARHVRRRPPRQPRQRPRPPATPPAPAPSGEPEPPGDAVAGLAEVLGQVPADRLGRSSATGRASMNRKSWTLTSGSPRVRSISRSSHQPRSPGRRAPADPVEQVAADLPGPALDRLGAIAVRSAMRSPSARRHPRRHGPLPVHLVSARGRSPHSFYGDGRRRSPVPIRERPPPLPRQPRC